MKTMPLRSAKRLLQLRKESDLEYYKDLLARLLEHLPKEGGYFMASVDTGDEEVEGTLGPDLQDLLTEAEESLI